MTSQPYLEFERPIVELERRIEGLKESSSSGVDVTEDIRRLERRLVRLQRRIFSRLTPWQITQLARHPNRPYTMDYINHIFEDFIELHGDRNFRDDPAIVGGLARLNGDTVMVVGHQKGRSTKDKVFRNFGMPNPEGCRKALRLMSLAERFRRPIISFIDTPGAFPGIGAEERGQAEAIAKNLMVMSRLRVPILVVVIGEGGSGGALAIGIGDRVLMLEYAIYSVISPEGCAAILWKDGGKADLAAEALKMTSGELLKLGVIDGIVKEPPGGAHRDWKGMATILKDALVKSIRGLRSSPIDEILELRYKRYRGIGVFHDPGKRA